VNIATSLRRHVVVAALLGFGALAAIAAVLLSHSTSAPADVNLNNLDCRGHIEKGEPSADDPGATQVKYVFACNGPITGYMIQPNVEVQSFETEVFATDAKTKEIDARDAFSCNGDLPGYGINCVGTYGFLDNAQRTFDPSEKSYNVVSSTFSIDGDICAEPRADPLLIVMTAVKGSSSNNSQPTQNIAGPFDLGRPRRAGCKATPQSGKLRIPKQGAAEDPSNSNVG
jgi:hypothetical protein